MSSTLPQPHLIAEIEETRCIGCTLCREACPENAIVGAVKQIHTILDDLCTGCDRCRPLCPVSCIRLIVCSVSFEPPPKERFHSSLASFPEPPHPSPRFVSDYLNTLSPPSPELLEEYKAAILATALAPTPTEHSPLEAFPSS
ncbi:MAG: RnfABCDGE type electron transport complex subunit B [Hydrogenophilus sp.]|nr:RnfABCDGE type electron transport complex subunit B [Hydrogenophilus sp.]